MENKKYSGYFCSKCKQIPLFQIIYQNNEIKIFSACKCHKQYESIDSFIKNKYKNDISDINIINESTLISNSIEEINKESKFNLDSIIKEFNNSKEKMIESANQIKNEIKTIYQKKIEEIDVIYNKYITNNNKIIFVIEKLIDSYTQFKDNKTIIENIRNNATFNTKYEFNKLLSDYNYSIKSSFKKIQDYFDKELIISTNPKSLITKKIESRHYPSYSDPIISFIQLDDDICASCSKKDNNIVIYDLKNDIKEKIILKAHIKYIYSMIKSDSNNIISIGDDGLIKVWPLIKKFMLLETKKKFDIENKNKVKLYYSYSNTFKTIELNLNPILSINYDLKLNQKIEKMLNLKNKCFLTSTKEIIALYNYSIDNSINNQIQKINEYEVNNISDVFCIYLNEKDAIALCTNNYISFLYLQNFTHINTINIKTRYKNCLLQLNSEEILIVDNYSHINIFSLNNFHLKLKINIYNDTDYFLNLNDGTFIFSCFEGMKRYLIKTMEELPQIIKFNSNYYDDDYYDYCDYDYENYCEKIVYLYQLNDGRIVACYKNGNISIINLKF